jgi:hypothetical protein
MPHDKQGKQGYLLLQGSSLVHATGHRDWCLITGAPALLDNPKHVQKMVLSEPVMWLAY